MRDAALRRRVRFRQRRRRGHRLRPLTRSVGLSLGDRCCLALAQRQGAVVLTTERHWQRIATSAGVEIRDIRAGGRSGA
jgi:PIN domain nuclease of toxin-antitoxin system